MSITKWLGPAAILGALLLVAASGAQAQRAQLQLARGPYYVGMPIEMAIVTEDFEEDPTPEVTIEPASGLEIELIGVSPSVRSSISIVNGQLTRTKEVQFNYRYRVISRRAGRLAIGPYTVIQGTTTARTGSTQIDFEEVPRGERISLLVTWPEEAVYPGQRVPVVLEWTFPAGLQDRMSGYAMSVPLFDRSDLFRFADEPGEEGDTELSISVKGGALTLRASMEEQGGRRTVRAERALIPMRSGEYSIEPASVLVDEVTRWQRDLFGRRTPAASRKLRAQDVVRTLRVRELPLAGRDDRFVGAIGRGFTLEASTDRSVVQVGDPIALTLVVRGDGNVESAGMPNLAAEGGLSSETFRVPQEQIGGLLRDGAKTFEVTIRVLDPDVEEIPPIPYVYFDSDRGTYETAYSRPIALSVRPASLVTARDVVRGEDSEAREARQSLPAEPESGTVPLAEAERSFSLTGANLSIVRDPALLRSQHRGGGGADATLIALYVAPLAVIGLAWWLRRRADVDPALVAMRDALRVERSRIAAAEGAPRTEALEQIADALRTMRRFAPGLRIDGLDSFLADCDAAVYAPVVEGSEILDNETRGTGIALAEAIAQAAEEAHR